MKYEFRVGGMTCVNCQRHIEEKLRGLDGVASARVDWRKGEAAVEYDASKLDKIRIHAAVESLDYTVLPKAPPPGETTEAARAAGLALIIAAAYFILEHFGILNMLAPSRLAEAGMSLGMLFVIGLVTSVHCVAMCGGINLSQCVPGSAKEDGTSPALLPAALYNAGRVVSYTVIGGIVGAVGTAFTLSSTTQGVIKLIAGVFMVIMGINMLGFFPWLRKINPHMPRIFAIGINRRKRSGAGPFMVGLLNGLMPCGPLQAMQIYALSTGGVLAGASAMFLFSLGTVPLMFGLGAIGGAMGKKFAHRAVTVGAALVVVLGMSMLTQGWSLAGNRTVVVQPEVVAETPPETAQSGVKETVQEIRSSLKGGRYPAITVKAGVPVRWTIDAPGGSLNGCNYRMMIPQYNIQYEFGYGDNVIEFIPDKPGKYTYTCWMGMIRSTITVTE